MMLKVLFQQQGFHIPEDSVFFETQEDKKIINQVLELVGLVKYKNKPFSLLSGGEKQKVMIARAFAQKPPQYYYLMNSLHT